MVSRKIFEVVIEVKQSVTLEFEDDAPAYAEKEVMAIMERTLRVEGPYAGPLEKALEVHPDWVSLPSNLAPNECKVKLADISTKVRVSSKKAKT